MQRNNGAFQRRFVAGCGGGFAKGKKINEGLLRDANFVFTMRKINQEQVRAREPTREALELFCPTGRTERKPTQETNHGRPAEPLV